VTAQSNFRFDVGYYSHVGGRGLNEDDYFHLAFHVGEKAVRLAGVADGMGGNHAGEAASQAAIQAAASYLVETLMGKGKALSPAFLEACVRNAVSRANRAVCELPGKLGQGTTLTLGVFTEGHAVIGHVGDSRCYLCTPGEARQLTRDHADDSGALTNRLGRWDEVEADVEVHELTGDALYVFCSDGVHGSVGPETIARVFESAPDPKQGCVRVVETALANAGPQSDNLTCVAVEAGSMPRSGTAGPGKVKRVGKTASPAAPQEVAQGSQGGGPAARLEKRREDRHETRRQKRFMLISGVVIVLLCGLLGVVLVERFWPGALFAAAQGTPDAVGAAADAPPEGLGGLTWGVIGLGAAALCCLAYLLMPTNDR
jgi:protein phosphatase